MITLGKRGRGLDPAVMTWLMTTLQIGPGIGDVHCLVKEGTAFESWLRDDLRVHPSKIHFDLAAAEDALTAGRNDVILTYPGRYTQTTELAWDKKHTHIVGMGGPNVMGHWRTSAESNMANTMFHTATAGLASLINITGENCQFHNIHVHNEGASATSYAAVIVDKFGCYFKRVAFRGATAATAKDNADCGSLRIDGAAHFPLFEDCIIGHNTYSAGTRDTAYSGHLIFQEGYPQNGHFKRCRFQLRSETANVGLVRIKQSVSADRAWLFEDCAFDNFYADWGAQLNAVFVYPEAISPQTSNFHLRNCSCYGFNEWTIKDHGGVMKQIQGNMPVASTGGGICVGVTTDESES